MNQLLADLRYGVRMLFKTPNATLTVLIALSLGIGVSALTFSLIRGAVLAELPVEGGDRIMRIERGDRQGVSAEDYAAWTARQRSFEGLAAAQVGTVTLAIEGAGAEPVRSASITPSLLPLLATAPTLGRGFTPDDAAPGAPATVLVSHDIWRDRLGGGADALGRVVRVNGQPAEVIGVLPEGFGFPWDQDVWSPLDLDPARPVSLETSTESAVLIGRLRDGVSPQDAARDLTALTRELDRERLGEVGPGSIVRVSAYTDLFSESGRSLALAALMLGVALLVLLVACANVANVLLARAVARRREVAIRLAIGASRARIITQLLVEISLLAAAGAGGGIALATLGARFIDPAMSRTGMPYWIAIRMDPPVLAFVAVVAVLAALAAGLMPALRASRSNTHQVLKDESRGSSGLGVGRLMRRLIGVEMALSFVLLVLAGLFVRSAANFQATEFAFQPDGVYGASVRLPDTAYGDPAARARFLDELDRNLSELPPVDGAVLATGMPGVGSTPVVPVQVEGATQDPGSEPLRARTIVVTPGFFDLFRAPLLAGRDFDGRDGVESLPVAIVNEAFAARYFPAGALDRRVRFPTPDGEGEWRTIIGVSADLMAGGVEAEVPEAVYLPMAQNPPSAFRILARALGGYAALPAPIRETVAALDPDVALFDVRPLEESIALANSQYTWFSILFLVTGGVALFLAAIGLYGVMAFWVIQRTREIGVRMALGGQRRDIVRLVLRQGMAQTAVGLVAGLLLAIPAARLLRFALFGVAPHDPIVFGSIVGVLLAAAWLGCWLPARRATRIDPLRALVAE